MGIPLSHQAEGLNFLISKERPQAAHTEAGQLGKVGSEAPAKTSCRIVMIVVILIAEGFRQLGESENLRGAFGNEKKKCGFSRPALRPSLNQMARSVAALTWQVYWRHW
jgi:hypothetical protein